MTYRKGTTVSMMLQTGFSDVCTTVVAILGLKEAMTPIIFASWRSSGLRYGIVPLKLFCRTEKAGLDGTNHCCQLPDLSRIKGKEVTFKARRWKLQGDCRQVARRGGYLQGRRSRATVTSLPGKTEIQNSRVSPFSLSIEPGQPNVGDAGRPNLLERKVSTKTCPLAVKDPCWPGKFCNCR